MAKKKIGIYSPLASTPNQKVEDLFLIVDDHSIAFSVKNIEKNTFVAFEYFENEENVEVWGPLMAYLQNNSKLIHAIYRQVHFVLNHSHFLITKKYDSSDPLLYQNELNLLHGQLMDAEIQVNELVNGSMIVFAVPDSLITLLTRTFPIGKWKHYAEWVISTKVGQTAEDNGSVQIHLFETNYLLSIQENGNLKNIKYITSSTPDQNCYSILNACQQLGVIPSQMHLQIVGLEHSSNQEMNETWSQLGTYFFTTKVISTPTAGIGESLNKEFPHHLYATYFIF
ncbi:MAG: DUF3822 family protein [Chitinophagaceae bacterium]